DLGQPVQALARRGGEDLLVSLARHLQEHPEARGWLVSAHRDPFLRRPGGLGWPRGVDSRRTRSRRVPRWPGGAGLSAAASSPGTWPRPTAAASAPPIARASAAGSGWP